MVRTAARGAVMARAVMARAVVSGAVVLGSVGFGLLVGGCSAGDHDGRPAPTASALIASAPPASAPPASARPTSAPSENAPTVGDPSGLRTAWFPSALPVDGTVAGIGVDASGSVRVTRDGDGIRIAFTRLTLGSVPDADLRVQLSSGDISAGPDGVSTFPIPAASGGLLGSGPVEVGLLSGDEPDAVVVFGSPRILPEVHSLLIVDYTSNTVLAGAELIPAE